MQEVIRLDITDLEERRMLSNYILKGTTTVGIACTDGVVLATDRRVTSGYYIAHRRGKKIHRIDDYIAVTIAGAVADAQKLVDQLKAELLLFKAQYGRPMSIKSLATLASTLLFNARPFIYIIQMIIGGLDASGTQLYTVDWFGSVTREKYTATGSGSPIAIGLLETEYNDKIKVKEAIPLAVKAVRSAMLRDPGSGEGVDVAVISRLGYRELSFEK